MSSQTCANCGAAIKPNATVCEYCGSSQNNVPGPWLRLDQHPPSRSATDPTRSDLLLVCHCSPTMEYYGELMVAAYYDFTKGEWKNDLYGASGNEIPVTHWMRLPAEESPLWRDTAGEFPSEEGEDPGYSVNVLTYDELNYPDSMISASVNLNPDPIRPYWSSYMNLFPVGEEELQVTFWMPMPPAPTG